MNSSERQSNVAFFIGYIVLFYLLGLMIWPYLSAGIFAGILAGTFYPLKMRLQKNLGRKWAATVTLFLMIATLFAPSVYILFELSKEAVLLFEFLKNNLTEEVIEEILFGEGLFGNAYIPTLLEEIFTLLSIEYNVQTIQGLILDSAKTTSSYLIDMVNSWVSNILDFLFQLIIMMVVIFSLLLEGERVKEFFLQLSPLPSEEEELVITKFNQMNYVTMVGNGIGGIIQGVLAGVGFWYFGFESVVLWTTTMIIFAFIPMVGISFVSVPASIYLMVSGQMTEGIVLLVYCTVIALVVEQWFKPKFVGNRVKIHSTLVFLSIIGGMGVFGFLGIFYGPLIISIFLTFVDLYHKRYTYPAYER